MFEIHIACILAAAVCYGALAAYLCARRHGGWPLFLLSGNWLIDLAIYAIVHRASSFGDIEEVSRLVA